jgi:hypothetical protein
MDEYLAKMTNEFDPIIDLPDDIVNCNINLYHEKVIKDIQKININDFKKICAHKPQPQKIPLKVKWTNFWKKVTKTL